MTEDQVVQIAAAFLREKRSEALPVLSVRFRPTSEALHPHLARDCWFVSFDRRKPGERFVQDPCTITVTVDASSSEPSFFGDL